MLEVKINIIDKKYKAVELTVDEFSFNKEIKSAQICFEVQDESASLAIVLYDKNGENSGQVNEDFTLVQLKALRKHFKKMIKKIEGEDNE